MVSGCPTAAPPDEAALIARCREGDRNAFDTLFERHEQGVRSFFLARGIPADDAEDLAQQTMINGYLGIRSFRGGARLATWLSAVARRVHVTWLRGSAHREEAVDPETVAAPLAPEGTTDLRMAIRDALALLPEHYRRTLLLSHVHGYSLREIGVLLDVPDTTVVNWLGRARRKMREALRAEGVWEG